MANGCGGRWRGSRETVDWAALPEPQASLLTGILLGDDSCLPKATADAFKTTGITHLIAISGDIIAVIR